MTAEIYVNPQSTNTIKTWLIQWIAKDLGLLEHEIDTSKSLLEYSLSSMTAMMLVGDLEDLLEITIIPTLVWDYPSIDALVEYLDGELQKNIAKNGSKIKEKEEIKQVNDYRSTELINTEDMPVNIDNLSEEEIDVLLNGLLK